MAGRGGDGDAFDGHRPPAPAPEEDRPKLHEHEEQVRVAQDSALFECDKQQGVTAAGDSQQQAILTCLTC